MGSARETHLFFQLTAMVARFLPEAPKVQLHDERLRALPSVDKEFRHPALAALTAGQSGRVGF